jgi:hypothetical protein
MALSNDLRQHRQSPKKDNRAAFEGLRSQLKKAGCRVTALDDAIAEETGETGGRGPIQADILIGLAQTANLFHVADGVGFADPGINAHRETWPIRARGFRRWLAPESHSTQRLRRAWYADGRQPHGRFNRRQRFNRPRQPVENQSRDRCGRCGRKTLAPIRAEKMRAGAHGYERG